MSLYQRQLDLEEEYSTTSLILGQEQILNAYKQGRGADVGAGRVLLAKAYEAALEQLNLSLAKKTQGLGGKYKKLLRIASSEVLVMAGLREIINGCANPEPQSMQAVLGTIGRMIETEAMLTYMQDINATYTSRTVEYLDSAGTKAISHRYRTFLAGARNMGLDWVQWSSTERMQVARLLVTELYEGTGLFKWGTPPMSKGASMYYLEPSEELAKHFTEVASAARASVKYPPMLVPPMAWEGQYDGGYLTDWFRNHAPMCGLRYIQKDHRQWILNHLNSSESATVRSAMTKAQNVPYRVNKSVLAILRKATAMRVGILGLPSFMPLPQPVFPLGEDWQKSEATVAELEQFQFWKQQMAAWYTSESKRKGRHIGILNKLTELTRYQDEVALYFPTFIDWRGRLYFRSQLNPQSSDAVKGCLEFSEGKRLGESGLKWLKVHVANSCGYDKHDPDIKAQWVDDNWGQICDFLDNPLDVDAPDPDTAFSLLQGGLALQEALELPDPREYVCHVPVAMDASCSGLQHLSALTRDPIGAYYTNLIDNGKEQKSDIYVQVAEVADSLKEELCTRKVKVDGATTLEHDPVVYDYWKDLPVSRSMSKNPVMTFVYGSTLINNIDTVALSMSELGMDAIRNADGKIIYSMSALATPIGKALRAGVKATVPEATKIMQYLQTVVRKHKEQCMRWVSPIGVPVVNWAEGTVVRRVEIRSMGVRSVVFTHSDHEYNTRSAANGIVPNFVHSMDAAHLCTTINEFNGAILPIHDSVATHPCDVDSMHYVLRDTFINLYENYSTEDFLEFNEISTEDYPVPEKGVLDLEEVRTSRFMFG